MRSQDLSANLSIKSSASDWSSVPRSVLYAPNLPYILDPSWKSLNKGFLNLMIAGAEDRPGSESSCHEKLLLAMLNHRWQAETERE